MLWGKLYLPNKEICMNDRQKTFEFILRTHNRKTTLRRSKCVAISGSIDAPLYIGKPYTYVCVWQTLFIFSSGVATTAIVNSWILIYNR